MQPTRILEWTGERFVFGAGDAQLWYEHAHRYALALGLAEKARVVDVGSGEGYGAAWLATAARSVVGVDIADDAIEHARTTYRADGLSFVVDDAQRLESIPDGEADLVTCFETVEHVERPLDLLDQLARIVAPGGLVLISTPDAAASESENPYHVHEFTAAQLSEALDRRFAHRLLFGQRVSATSSLWPLSGQERFTQVSRGIVWRNGLPELAGPSQDAVYTVAVCAQHDLTDLVLPGPATLVDPTDELLADLRGQLVRARDQLGAYETELAARARALEDADRAAAGAREQLSAYETELAGAAAASQTDRQAAELRARRLLAAAVRREQDLAAADQALRDVGWRLEDERRSLGGRLLGSYRRKVERALPAASRRRRWYTTVNKAARRLVRIEAPPPPSAITLPTRARRSQRGQPILPIETNPVVSIVIPVYGQLQTTLACLESIAAAATAVPYEVVVVDDASPDGTADALAAVAGIRLIRNEANRGYLHSTNAGAAAATGDFLVLLNNDTTVSSGWLDALVDSTSDPDVGAVGAKFLSPDGTLSEAGGIVFADGTPWIYGRGSDPQDARFQWRREVDYASAACLLVRASTWNQLNGFDTRYAPAYYEDTDLSFRIRELGQKVVYEPRAVIVHAEGGTHGSAEGMPGKRLRANNHVRFVGRWQAALPGHQLPGEVFRARRRGPDRAVLVIDAHFPTPDLDSGSVRMTRLLALLQESGRHVCFLPQNPVEYADYAPDLQSAGIEVGDPRHDLGRWLDDLAPEVDLVVLSRPGVADEYLPAIRRHLPDAVIAYDMVDYHALREQRRQLLYTEQDPLGLAAVVDDCGHPEISAMERRACRQAEIVIAVSHDEQELLSTAHPGKKILFIPNIHAEARLEQPFSERSGFVFIGGYDHPPNRDAAHVLVTQIWPRIRRTLPDTTLQLVGSHMTPEIAALAGDGVVTLGWVADLSGILAGARVFLAPLRYGAGLKGKVGQALSVGIPVVTTSVGAEGMLGGAADDRAAHLSVEDDLETFAKAAVSLHQDGQLWIEQVVAGRAYIDATLSPTAVASHVRGLLSASDDLLARRRTKEKHAGQ